MKNKKQKQKQKRCNDVPPTSSSLDEMGKKARLTEKVIARLEDSDSSDDEDNRRKKLRKVIQENPPVVIFTDGLGIKTCQGCGKAITKEQMYPSNMVFKQKGVKAIYNKKYNCMWNKKQNNHFHLSMRCLREKYPDLEYKDIIMNDETFESLSREQMKVLNDMGLLKFILKNKKRNMTSI